MKALLILLFTVMGLSSTLASSWEWTGQEICNIQADYVNDLCGKFEGEVIRNCLVTEMEVQDFYQQKDFIIDSDLTVFCLPSFI